MLFFDAPQPLLVVTAVLLGLLFGSFLNVVIHRVPREQSIAFPPSTCPSCGARIRPYDNVPVLSWLLLRGKARCCGATISARYPLVEVLGGLVGWSVVKWLLITQASDTELWVGLLLFVAHFALAMMLLALVFIDLEHMLLPDSLTLGGALLGLITVPLRPIELMDALVGGGLGFLMVWLPFDWGYRLLRGHPGMGLGDAKLLGLAGVWFGWQGALFALVFGALQGTLVAIAVFITQGKIEEPEAVQQERAELKRELEQMTEDARARVEAELEGDILLSEPEEGLAGARLPFGPLLILSILEFMFFQETIEQWFLEYFWQI